jgi:DNA-binding XRE family transcriptional regulator
VAILLIIRGIINRRIISRGFMGRGLIGDGLARLRWMPRDTDLAALGSRIRELRSRRGWSQEGFADRCGLDRTYVGGIERGERNLAVINLLRIARTLEVPVGTLFEKVEAETRRQ